MPQSNEGKKGFLTSEAINRALRVKLAAAGTVSKAGSGEEGIGTAWNSAASGKPITVDLDHPSVEATASGAITAANPCYAAANGLVGAVVAGRRIGIALESVTDGNKFEMMIAPQTS